VVVGDEGKHAPAGEAFDGADELVGHSTGDTVFHDEEGGILFSGDHLLDKISSNALVTGEIVNGEQIRTGRF